MRIASCCYSVKQGLGWLMKWFYDAGVITDPIIYKHSSPSRVTETSWYPSNTPIVGGRGLSKLPEIKQVLSRVDILLCFETFFDWELVNLCKSMGVKSVLMPMMEWTPRVWPAKPDWILAPSALDYDYFKDEFPNHIEYIPVPVDNSTWRLRTKATTFLHNAGNVGHREHKGTRQFVEAIPLVKNCDARFIIRAQDTDAMDSILQGNPDALHDPRLTVDYSERPWSSLWDGADVYVAPEKFNGLTLPPVEAYAAGLPVITTDRYPLNSVLPQDKALFVQPASIHRASISGAYREFDECVVEPSAVAAKIDEWCGRDITAESEMTRSWGEGYSWAALRSRYNKFISCVLERS